MTTEELLKEVYLDLDSRHLKNPRIRKNAATKIVEFMETAGQFINGTQVILPEERNRACEKYEEFKGKKLTGAEKHVLKIMYDILSSTSVGNKPHVHVPQEQKFRQEPSVESESIVDIQQIKTKLVHGSFYSVDTIGRIVPDVPGLYCIKLRSCAAFPENFGQIRDDRIIYIGKASKSLYERLWEEELNCKRPATFFRSIGAMLGYRPPKGSLYGKSSKNYKFDKETEIKIRKWMRQSLLVNFVEVPSPFVADVESDMIRKYRPLVNIQGNPDSSDLLKRLRTRCLEYARLPN